MTETNSTDPMRSKSKSKSPRVASWGLHTKGDVKPDEVEGLDERGGLKDSDETKELDGSVKVEDRHGELNEDGVEEPDGARGLNGLDGLDAPGLPPRAPTG